MCIYMAYCIVSMYIILDVLLVVHSFISPFWVCLDLYIYIINIYKNKCTLQFVSHSVHKCACVCVWVCGCVGCVCVGVWWVVSVCVWCWCVSFVVCVCVCVCWGVCVFGVLWLTK